MQLSGCMDIETEPSRGLPYQGIFQKTEEFGSTIPRFVHLEGGIFSCHRGMEILPYTSDYCSFGHGTSIYIRDPHVPVVLSQCAVIPHSSSSTPARGTSTEPAVSSSDRNGYSRLRLLLLFRGAAALPSTATVTSNSVLPRRCLLCHTKIRHGIRPIMCQQCSHLVHRK